MVFYFTSNGKSGLATLTALLPTVDAYIRSRFLPVDVTDYNSCYRQPLLFRLADVGVCSPTHPVASLCLHDVGWANRTIFDALKQGEVVPSVYTIYMGKDKYENEDLIKYGWPEDIWFHVDKLSSAHVYLRLHKGQTMDDIPKEVLIDCAQLVKANSIQGCKMNNVNVVYTPWANLKKTADMDVGQIGFHRQKDVKILTVEKKVNEILNRLEKTKVERFPDLAAEKEARDREERNEKKAQIQEMKRKEKEEMKKKKELEELRSYSSLMKAENMSSNQDGNDSDDFM